MSMGWLIVNVRSRSVFFFLCFLFFFLCFFQAEDGIRDLVRSRGLGDVYKRQPFDSLFKDLDDATNNDPPSSPSELSRETKGNSFDELLPCLLYTSDAADERSSVDLGGRRIIKKKKKPPPRPLTTLDYVQPRNQNTI